VVFGEGEYVTIPIVSKPGRRVSIVMFLFLQFGCIFQDSLSATRVRNKKKIMKKNFAEAIPTKNAKSCLMSKVPCFN